MAALAAFALTVSLGNWQMRRAEEKAAAQRLLDAAQASGPVRLDGAALADPRKLSGMRVELTGRFQDRYAIFIDNRSYRGRAGFHVLTPFASDSLDRPVLVLRGWVPQDPAQRSRLPALPEGEGLQRIVARVQTDLEQALELAAAVEPGPGDRLWQNASVARVARWSGLDLAPLVLRQLDPESEPKAAAPSGSSPPAVAAPNAFIRDWPSPGTGVDKHHGYAFQWYSMAAAIAGLWLWFFRRKIKSSR